MCSEPACIIYCCFYEFLKKIEAWRLAPVYPNAYRNLLNSSIHVATTNYYRNSFTIFQNDMKKTLSTIKHLIDNSKKYYIQACKRWVEYDRRNSCSRKFKLISYACRNWASKLNSNYFLPCKMFILTNDHLFIYIKRWSFVHLY